MWKGEQGEGGSEGGRGGGVGHVYFCVLVRVYGRVSVRVRVCEFVCLCVCVCVCVHAFVHVYACAWLRVCTHSHMPAHRNICESLTSLEHIQICAIYTVSYSKAQILFFVCGVYLNAPLGAPCIPPPPPRTIAVPTFALVPHCACVCVFFFQVQTCAWARVMH